jgi:hypothetical protein
LSSFTEENNSWSSSAQGRFTSLLVKQQGNSEAAETAEEWIDMIDRGGLWRVNNAVFQFFCALEEDIKHLLHSLKQNVEESQKKMIISKLKSSEDVMFYWSIVCADLEIDHEVVHSELLNKIVDLFVTL